MTETVDDLLGIVPMTDNMDDPVDPIAEPVEVTSEPEQPTPSLMPTQDELLDILMSRIVPVTEADPYLRVCIYGYPGHRKTTFTATALDALMMELDTGGSKSLMNHANLARNVDKLPFRSMAQFNMLLDALVRDDPKLAKYKTFIVDTYNGLQSKDLSEIPFMSDGKPNYNINTQNLKMITDKLKQVQKHVIITAHVKEVKEDSTGRILRRPDLTDKVAAAVYGDFDIIGFMSLEGDDCLLRLKELNGTTAKSRVGGLPEVMVNPTFDQIVTAYNNMRTNSQNASN